VPEQNGLKKANARAFLACFLNGCLDYSTFGRVTDNLAATHGHEAV
jgi:hypothetical protein